MFSTSYQHPPSNSLLSESTRHQYTKQSKLQPSTTQSLAPQDTPSHRIRHQSISTTTTRNTSHHHPPSTPHHPPQPNSPTCANCGTQTTPLWRRNQSGATLCNACALFQKMKGRPRPISLKTNIIKSRNRIKAIDRIPIPSPAPHPPRLNTGGSSNSSSTTPPIHPHSSSSSSSSNLYHHQRPTSSHPHNSPYSPPSPSCNSPQAHLHPDQAYRKPSLGRSKQDVFRFTPQPLTNSSALNLPSTHLGHSQSVPTSLFRLDTSLTRKSLPGGPDPFSLPSSLPQPSAFHPKRRKQSLNASLRPTENTFPISRTFSGPPGLSSRLPPTPRASSNSSTPGFQSPNSGYSPPIRRDPLISQDLHESPTDDHHTFKQSSNDTPVGRARLEEKEKAQRTHGVDRGQPIVLPPLSQLTQHLNQSTNQQSILRTTELGPPKSFEASAREARFHSPVSPHTINSNHNNLLAIPMRRVAEPRRALSVLSSVSDPDSVLSPIRISSPGMYHSSPPHRQTSQPQTEPPITPPVFPGSPLPFHRRPSGVSHSLTAQPTIELADGLDPHSPHQKTYQTQVPVEELCQLKKRIAELELINGRMVSRLGELERPSQSPRDDKEGEKEDRHASSPESDHDVSGSQDQSESLLEEDEEEDMIDETY